MMLLLVCKRAVVSGSIPSDPKGLYLLFCPEEIPSGSVPPPKFEYVVYCVRFPTKIKALTDKF